MSELKFNPVFAALPTTIFTHLSALAVKHNAVNLGQGFPDEDGPLSIRQVASKALLEGPNQYPPTRGVMPLRNAIANHAKYFYGLDFNAETDVLVTSGGTEALTAAIMGLAGPGGEVVLIEPAYDSYGPIAEAVGAKVKSVKLSPPAWKLDADALAAAMTPNSHDNASSARGASTLRCRWKPDAVGTAPANTAGSAGSSTCTTSDVPGTRRRRPPMCSETPYASACANSRRAPSSASARSPRGRSTVAARVHGPTTWTLSGPE